MFHFLFMSMLTFATGYAAWHVVGFFIGWVLELLGYQLEFTNDEEDSDEE